MISRIACMWAVIACGAATAEPLLPDLIADTSLIFDPLAFNGRMQYHIGTHENYPGRALLKFGGSIPNLGPGHFILRSTAMDEDGLEPVTQEIRQSDSSPSTQRPVEGFQYNNVSRFMETFDWVAYRIRENLPGDIPGETLRTGQKPEVRLVSSTEYNPDIVPPSPERINLTHSIRRMGVSVGYTDIYTNDLELQWIDVTGLKQGEYWLEVEVDFAHQILEANEDNNVHRSKVVLDDPVLPTFETHRADTSGFGVISLSEILRVIQLFNGNLFACAENTEDGYDLGGNDHGCQRHSSDFEEPFWELSLSELLRGVQLFNMTGYQPCEGSEDGFCPTGI